MLLRHVLVLLIETGRDEYDGNDAGVVSFPAILDDLLLEVLALLGVEVDVRLEEVGKDFDHGGVDVLLLPLSMLVEVEDHLFPALAEGRHLLAAKQ